MNNTLETMNTKADEILKKRTKEQKALSDQLREERAAAAKAEAAMDKATAAGDLKAYQSAKKDKADATDAIEMHSARFDALEHKPLVTEAEYNKAIASIMGELTAENNRAKEKLTALADEMKATADELAEIFAEGNALLHKWQHDVFRDDATKTTNDGKKIHRQDLEKQWTNLDAVSYGNIAVDHPLYKVFRGM